ncbi:MFS transporter [Geodermatophilus ruber]|uniref:Nitrate/nitrite transporter NarK n=1 Tax=Geodermatophilus ruber TaxID=504800 RepID=A0A1I4F820_9ACTN|nr:MFS transporter [Geodermatophilus ruber]SFL14122.1 Nitrate/nitrite transporter NarK [Geodermatophilus ruber]
MTARTAGPSRLVLAATVANLAAGTLFGWSLVAQDAAAGVGMSGSAAAGVFATAIVVLAGAVLVAGPAQRRVGPRRLLVIAAVLGGGGLLLAAVVRGPVALWSGVALLFGAGGGLAYGVAVGLAARVPAARRGTATGVVVAAYAAGPVLLGLVAPSALRAVGWRTCLAVLAVVVAALLAAAARLAPAGTAHPDGRPGRAAGVPRRVVSPLWLVFAGGTAPGLLLFAHAVPLAADRQLGPQAAGLAVSALAAGNLTGRLVAGWWSDRIGRVPALAAALAAAAVSVGLLAGPTAPPVVLAGFLGTGVAYGAVSSLVPAATGDRAGPDAFATAYGRVFTGWGLAGLLAPVAGGSLLAVAGDRPVLLGLAAVPLLPAAAGLLLLRRPASRTPAAAAS